MAISMLKIRRRLGRLIFNMGITIPGKTVFLIETAPCLTEWTTRYNYGHYTICILYEVFVSLIMHFIMWIICDKWHWYITESLKWHHKDIDSYPSGQNGCHLADSILKHILFDKHDKIQFNFPETFSYESKWQ